MTERVWVSESIAHHLACWEAIDNEIDVNIITPDSSKLANGDLDECIQK